ncbi:MAG: FkbM family methyltransferase [Candidatus Omnitrophica bacterium]|nr:FkbM family methyltransferase [Candidatus Omnitrophota bacterium]
MAQDLLENNPLYVVDVGASGGIDPRWAKFTSFYKGILFEPDPREYETLKAKSGNNLVVINSALSDSADMVDFNLCRKQEVSSVYLPNFNFLNKFPECDRFEVIKSIKIQTETLDNQLRKNSISEIDFIKIDTQGYELPILKGGRECLNNVIGLELEVEFASLYKNQPLFNEVDNFIREKGFELFDIKRCYWKRNRCKNTGSHKGQLVFGDALYFKSPEQVLLIKGVSPEKIIRSICVYLVYGYLDLAQILFNLANEKGLFTKEIHDQMALILAKHEKINFMPNFKGKNRIWGVLEKMTRMFSHCEWYSGTDKSIGN